MEKSPAYQLYPKDILTSQRVALMSLAEEGAYRRALDLCWLEGSLPNDAKLLSRLIGKGCTLSQAKIVLTMFIVCPDNKDRIINERQEVERVKQAEWRRKSSEAGKKSAAKRSDNGSNQNPTTVEPTLDNGSNQNPTLQFASSFPKLPKGSDARPKDFDEVLEYFTELSRPDLAQEYFDHFTGNGWKTGKSKADVKDWKATARTWKKRDVDFNGTHQTGGKKLMPKIFV